MLKLIKITHTIIWAIMVTAILYTFYCGVTGSKTIYLWMAIGLIIFEGFVLLINKGTCPLTPLARKYSTEIGDNFDIYLPNWLAKYNKQIFTTLFMIGLGLIII